MIKESTKLQSFVDLLIPPGAKNEPDTTSLMDTVAAECHRIKCAVYEIFKSEPGPDIAEWDVNNFHAKLVKLADKVTSSLYQDEAQLIANAVLPEGDVKPLPFLLYCLTDILNFNETSFRGIINDKQPIPQFYMLKMKDMLERKWPVIKDGLNKKRVASWMVREISSGLKAMLKRGYPPVDYRNYRYFQVFLAELMLLASDQRKKNWEQRILYFLIHFNFNHMGFFNHWTTLFRKKLEAAAQTEDMIRLIANTEHLLNHTSVIKELAYDPDSASLNEHLLLFLAEQRELIASQGSVSPAKHVKLQMQLSADDLSIDFYYRHRHKLFNYTSKKDAARAYAAVHSSSHSKDISAHSIERFDKKRLLAAAVKYHRFLMAVDRQVIKDFNLREKESD